MAACVLSVRSGYYSFVRDTRSRIVPILNLVQALLNLIEVVADAELCHADQV